jgi:glycosyltransferase involved in cell wall biosynthesis
LKKFVPNAKYKVLPHPVYSKFGDPVNKAAAKRCLSINDEKVILFFGLIREYKGLDVLLEALSLLKGKLNLKLIVAGEFYSDEKKYRELISRYDLSNLIYLFNNFISEPEVKYYFSASDAVILPYKDATQSGIVQIAMNFRKPVIASNVGGLGEVVINGKTGYVVEKENPQQLADAVLKFYNENKEQEFVRNIEQEVDKYSWKRFVEGILEIV